jgi:hypothetical protein
MSEDAIQRNDDELVQIRAIAESGNDSPVLMLNLNLYSDVAQYPGGDVYLRYMAGLEGFLPVVGGKVLWRMPVYGQPVGTQRLDEVLAAWYPSHQAFLDLRTAPGSDENFRLRALAVEYAVIHRCPGSEPLLTPPGSIAR